MQQKVRLMLLLHCGRLYPELWRAAACEGGDDDDDDGGVREVLNLWLKVVDGKEEAVLTPLQTYMWLNSLQLRSTDFLFLTFKYKQRKNSSVQNGAFFP